MKALTRYCLLTLLLVSCSRLSTDPVPVAFVVDSDVQSSIVTKASGATQVLSPIALKGNDGQPDLYVSAVAIPMGERLEDYVTKAVPYSSTSGIEIDGTKHLGMAAYTYPSNSPAPAASAKTVYGTRTLDYSGTSGRWLPTDALYYPNTQSGYIQFFAFAPYDAAVTSFTADSEADPTITYTVPAAINSQRGLLVAEPVERQSMPALTEVNVPLVFHHVLSGVSFQVEDGLTINSIVVSGVYDHGTCNLNTREWSALTKIGGSGTPTWTFTNPSVHLEDSWLRRLDDTLMMMPQVIPSGATISVSVQNVSASTTISYVLDIGGQLWEQGKLVHYMLAYDPDNLLVIRGTLPNFTEESLEL